MSQCRMSKSMTVTTQNEGKRRTVAYIWGPQVVLG